jgi:hypothetical protein
MTTLATGVGSMPGDDTRAYAEAVRLTLRELPDLGVDLQPAGWRLTGASPDLESPRPLTEPRRGRSPLTEVD